MCALPQRQHTPSPIKFHRGVVIKIQTVFLASIFTYLKAFLKYKTLIFSKKTATVFQVMLLF